MLIHWIRLPFSKDASRRRRVTAPTSMYPNNQIARAMIAECLTLFRQQID